MRELAPEVWLVESRLPYAINAYLVGDTLIDCATRHSARRFARELKGRAVSNIALTHAHPDHQGLAASLSKQLDVPVYCHPGDLPVLRGEAPDPNCRWINRAARQLMGGPPVPNAEPLTATQRFAGFRMVHLPGHTAGSVLFYRDADRVAICGDVIQSFWLPGMGVRAAEPFHVFCDDWHENQRSIRMLWELQPRVVLPGHGPPVTNPHALERLATKALVVEPAPCPAR